MARRTGGRVVMTRRTGGRVVITRRTEGRVAMTRRTGGLGRRSVRRLTVNECKCKREANKGTLSSLARASIISWYGNFGAVLLLSQGCWKLREFPLEMRCVFLFSL